MYMYGHLDVRKQVFDGKFVSWLKHGVPNTTPPSANKSAARQLFMKKTLRGEFAGNDQFNEILFFKEGGGVSSINIFCPLSYIKNVRFFIFKITILDLY